MAILERAGVRIHYTDVGSGPAVLLLAPGGMRSSIPLWANAPWNPIEQLAATHRVIAMDQRNAGESAAAVTGGESWATYTADQLALLDHLGVGEFQVLGMCIGGAFILGLLTAAPQRVTAAVALQPIGLDGNREVFFELFDGWAAELAPSHPEAGAEQWRAYREAMYGGDDVLFSVPTTALDSIRTPVLVLQGDDVYHPRSAARLVASRIPGARLIERWKDPADLPAARAAVGRFLAG